MKRRRKIALSLRRQLLLRGSSMRALAAAIRASERMAAMQRQMADSRALTKAA
jgi:hypothetical protein